MISIVSFQAAHLAAIKLQDAQAYLSEWVTHEEAVSLENHASFTAVSAGEVLGCGGAIPVWEGRSIAWSYLANIGPKNFLQIHHAVANFLNSLTVKRIEITVDCDVLAAHRWARLLGFKLEAERMEAYTPDGRPCALYARVA